MADYIDKLRNDLVEQFRGKPVIDALVEAIGEQMNDLRQFFDDLKDRRSLYTAQGKQLDGIGDIVVLNRTDAGTLACVKESVHVLEDDEYRRFLIYKIWKNTNNCTYEDILKSFRMFWDKPLYYSERPDCPATMFLSTDLLTEAEDVRRLQTAPYVKAAGVGIHITIRMDSTPVETRIGTAMCCVSGTARSKLALRNTGTASDGDTGVYAATKAVAIGGRLASPAASII